MSEHKKQFEAIVAVYGIADRNGNVFTEQAALKLFDTIRRQAELQEEISGMPGYRVVSARMEGDRQQGKVFATFQTLADDIPTWSSLGMSISDEALRDQGIPDQELWDGINTSYQVYLSFLDKWVDVLLCGVDFSHPTHECIEVTPEFFDTDKQEWARSYSAHAFQASGYKVYDPPNSFLRAKLTRAQWRRYLRRVPQQNLQSTREFAWNLDK